MEGATSQDQVVMEAPFEENTNFLPPFNIKGEVSSRGTQVVMYSYSLSFTIVFDLGYGP